MVGEGAPCGEFHDQERAAGGDLPCGRLLSFLADFAVVVEQDNPPVMEARHRASFGPEALSQKRGTKLGTRQYFYRYGDSRLAVDATPDLGHPALADEVQQIKRA